MPTRPYRHVYERERTVCGQQPAHLLHHHRHMPPVRCVVFVSHCQIHRRSQTQLLEKFRIHNFFLGGRQNLLEDLLVPKLKMILPRRKRDLAIQLGELAQAGRNQNSPLPIDGHFMRSTDKECLERLNPRIESWLGSQIRDEYVPLARRIKRQASLSVVWEIGDIKAIVIFALQYFAEASRDAHPPLFIDRMVEPTTKHRVSSPPPHNIPLFPTTVKQSARPVMRQTEY